MMQMQELMQIKKIDAHTHLAKCSGLYMMSSEEREQYNRIMGIDRCILLANAPNRKLPAQVAEQMVFNEDAARLCQENPGKYDWLCNLIPDGTEKTRDELKKCKKLGARGVGEFSSRLRLDSPVMRHFLSCCEELEMPFLFHMAPEDAEPNYGVVDDAGLPALENILRDFPKLVVLAHSQPVWFEISVHSGEASAEERNRYHYGAVKPGRLVELMDRYPNLYLDLSARSAGSALLRDPDFSVGFIEKFADRLIFGTDALAVTDVMALGPWLELMALSGRISPENYRKILRDNAVRVFRLQDSALA